MRCGMILIVFALLSPIGFSATIYVPDDYPAIQDAINASADGDTVIVRPGTYVENIDFVGKRITVGSDQGATGTTIDGSSSGSVVTFQSGEGTDSVLVGFTLTNGKGVGYPNYTGGGITCANSSSPTITNNIVAGNEAVYGGGIDCTSSSSPTISNNNISWNTADFCGGGIYCEDSSSPAIANNTITRNKDGGGIHCMSYSSPTITNNTIASNKNDYDGGGIDCDWYSSPTITNNTIAKNTAGADGGGISCARSSSPAITDNTITENNADSDGGGIHCTSSAYPAITNNTITENIADWGGGINCDSYSTPTITSNIITGNTAGRDGGGILCSSSSPVITSNTIAGNTATGLVASGGGISCYTSSVIITNNTLTSNTADWGGGIHCYYQCSLTVTNTILWDNSASQGKEIWVGSTTFPSTLTISYSNVENGQSGCHVDPGCTLDWGAGMIDAAPLLSDPASNDFHLTWSSPCRQAGNNSTVTELFDFEGDPRIHDGTVDMGADEFHLHLYSIGDAIPGSSIDVKVVGTPGTSPLTLGLGSGIQYPPQSTSYGDLWLQSPILARIPMPNIGADGLSLLNGTIPASWLPGEQYPFQALAGSELTNLMVMMVE